MNDHDLSSVAMGVGTLWTIFWGFWTKKMPKTHALNNHLMQ